MNAELGFEPDATTHYSFSGSPKKIQINAILPEAKVAKICPTESSAFALTSKGDIFFFGKDSYGFLDPFFPRTPPEPKTNPAKAIRLSASDKMNEVFFTDPNIPAHQKV